MDLFKKFIRNKKKRCYCKLYFPWIIFVGFTREQKKTSNNKSKCIIWRRKKIRNWKCHQDILFLLLIPWFYRYINIFDSYCVTYGVLMVFRQVTCWFKCVNNKNMHKNLTRDELLQWKYFEKKRETKFPL